MVIVIPRPALPPSGLPAATVAGRRNASAFIVAQPTDLALLRPTREKTPSRGYRTTVPTEPNVAEQTFRLIPQHDEVPEVNDSNGRGVQPKFVIMGEFDADLERWDYFEHDGSRWQVATIWRRPQQHPWWTKGSVILDTTHAE